MDITNNKLIGKRSLRIIFYLMFSSFSNHILDRELKAIAFIGMISILELIFTFISITENRKAWSAFFRKTTNVNAIFTKEVMRSIKIQLRNLVIILLFKFVIMPTMSVVEVICIIAFLFATNCFDNLTGIVRLIYMSLTEQVQT